MFAFRARFWSEMGFWLGFFSYVQNLFYPTEYWPCNLTVLIRENLLPLSLVISTFLKKNGRILTKNQENQHWYLNLKLSLCKWKTKESKETFLCQNSNDLLYKTWWFMIYILKTLIYKLYIFFSYSFVIPNGNFELYRCNKIITTQIQISRQNWNGFFSNISHRMMI